MARPRGTKVGQDGAQNYLHKPYQDYIADPTTGIRPKENKQPIGKLRISLEDLLLGVTDQLTLPPRSIWRQGAWATVDVDDPEWNVWVVPGEGTPGNYEYREYVIPEDLSRTEAARHPVDWPKKYREPKRSTPLLSSGGAFPHKLTPPAPTIKKASSGMPLGTKACCIGCGHWFKIDALSDHVQGFMCPAQQGDLVMFVQPCECHNNPADTAVIQEGFPKQLSSAPQAKEEEKIETT